VDQQIGYNRRKLIVAFFFFVPYISWVMVSGDRNNLPSPQASLVIFLGYLLLSYLAMNFVLRWLAKRWP
jgi:hypothetical protein